MKTFALVLAFAVVGALADGPHAHGRQGRARSGGNRRQQQRFRSGRDEELPAYADAAGAPADAPLSNYAANDAPGDDNLAMLEKSIPGVPGQDYPILAEVPDSQFTCDGQVDGGYYADPEAQCQVFHICTADGQGGLTKYSFLCPNGTIFNQNYFICDWWFNFDCSEAEGLYSLNEKIAAEREAASGKAADGAQAQYGAPAPAPPAPQRKAAAPPPPPPAPTADYEEEEAEAPAGAGYAAPEADAGAEQPLGTYEAEGDRQGRAFRGGRQQQGRRQQQQVRGGQQGRRGRQQFRG